MVKSQNVNYPLITLDVVRDVETFRNLREEWTELLQDCPCNNFFLTWEWMYTWWLQLAGKRTLNLILVRRDGLLIAIAPLALQPSRYRRLIPFRLLEFVASGNVGSDYLSILIRTGHEEDALREIGAHLTLSNRLLELVRVEKSSFVMINMALQLCQSGWECIGLTTNYSPFVKLTGLTWESYLDSLHHSHRNDVQRKTRKINREFSSIRLDLVSTEAEREVAMDTFLRLHLDRWSERGGSNAFNKDELVRFHDGLSRLCLEQGWLRMYTLSLNGKAVASLYVFSYNKVYYYYQAAFDPEYSKYSVGMLILSMAIRAAIKEGAAEFDFLHDDEEYKYLWAREERELIRLDLYPPRNKGRIYKQAVRMKCALKRMLWHISPSSAARILTQREY